VLIRYRSGSAAAIKADKNLDAAQVPAQITTMEAIEHGAAAALIAISLFYASGSAAAEVRNAVRRDFYISGAIAGCAFASLFPLIWVISDRPLHDFGVEGWSGSNPVDAIRLAAAWVVILILSMFLVLHLWREFVSRFFGNYDFVMPTNRGELQGSWIASIAAGAGEEIAYRGFLLWYLATLINLPVAILLSSVIFGLAHGYQRRAGMLFATGAGLMLTGSYLASGSLLLVMWMHASYNMASFTLGYLLLRNRAEATAGQG
jgi:membrane protease YdiL (CAAX protease family)